MSTGGEYTIALLLRGRRDFTTQPEKFGTHFRERAQHGGCSLDLRGQQLGRDPLLLIHDLLRSLQHASPVRTQLAGLGVYDLILLLDTQSVLLLTYRHTNF